MVAVGAKEEKVIEVDGKNVSLHSVCRLNKSQGKPAAAAALLPVGRGPSSLSFRAALRPGPSQTEGLLEVCIAAVLLSEQWQQHRFSDRIRARLSNI